MVTVTYDGDAAGPIEEVRDVSCERITAFYNHPLPSDALVMKCSFLSRAAGRDTASPAKITMVKIDGHWTEFYWGILG